jgi:putative DNA primase/helicase
VEVHGKEYRHVPGWGWMRLDETRWTRDAKLMHFDDVRKLCRQTATSCESAEAKRLARAQTVAAVVQLARADQRIVVMPEAFDADRMSLNTPAGIVDLRDATIRPRAGEYLTKCTAIAPAMGDEPLAWLRFLSDVFDDDEIVIAFVRRLLGYALTGETREQIVAFFHGDGENGKSTLLDVVLTLMGDYAIKVPTSMLMAQRGERHPADVAQLCGARLAVSNEISEGEHWDEARVKELTGDMRITARFMRQDFFQFDASHKFIIAANHRPQVRTMDRAMRRRLLLVPFTARFSGERRDPHMLDKLRAEAGAILAWMIVGAVEWNECGLMVPESVRVASEAYADAMDSLGLWLSECCDRSDPDLREAGQLLYDSYRQWKEARGEHAVSLTRWAEQMQSRGIQKIRDNGAKYLGITLTSDARYRAESERR